MKTFFRLVKLAWPLKWGMVLATLVGFLTIGSAIGLMATSAWLISMAALHPSVAALGVAIVGVRFFGIARGVFRYLERLVSHEVTFRLLSRLRVWFYRGVEPLAPAILERYRSGDLLSRVVSDIDTLQNFYLRVLAPPLVAVVTGLGMWLLLGAYNPVFAFAFLGFYILAGVGVPWLTHLLSKRLAARSVVLRSDLNASLVDGIQGMAELVAFGQEDRQNARIEKLNRELVRVQVRLGAINALQGSLGSLLTNVAAWTILVLAIPIVRNGQMDPVYLALVVLATLASFEAVLPLGQAFQYLAISLVAADRLFEIVDKAPPVRTLPATGPTQAATETGDYSLEVKDISFSYEPGQPDALQNLTFSLRPGQSIALVGESGAGKSTLANLLLRFWDYERGEIRLGGRDLKTIPPEEVRNIIGLVSQRTHLFNATIRENLAIANPKADQAAIEAACQQAQIHDFITGLPQGYATPVGEFGMALSGGERQRLSIARAILKNAPILVLDEPTANLDRQNEQLVMQALHSLMKDRSTILITHRLVDLAGFEEILVLRSGQVIERGDQSHLLQEKGLFNRLWQLQTAPV
ncbi:MAG: thiol reductant ABC exporter subunit CydC [Chloroflexi bacterium]|nr:thiol reductant ABC exporter subunit CydC [Chloroflexota bacterium]OJV92474.1 MAG: thiol reductant ABC exporter subunit CydC [Chloroflexi bacterium 54-19]